MGDIGLLTWERFVYCLSGKYSPQFSITVSRKWEPQQFCVMNEQVTKSGNGRGGQCRAEQAGVSREKSR